MSVVEPSAWKVCPLDTVAPALAVISPVAVSALFTVVVPLASPIETVVASPPMFKVVVVVLKREATVLVVVISPPFNAKSPVLVMLPLFAIVNWVTPEGGGGPDYKGM